MAKWIGPQTQIQPPETGGSLGRGVASGWRANGVAGYELGRGRPGDIGDDLSELGQVEGGSARIASPIALDVVV